MSKGFIHEPQIINELALETYLSTSLKLTGSKCLWDHQKACVWKMRELEQEFVTSKFNSESNIYRGILHQPPGNGKTRIAINLAINDRLCNLTLFVVSPNLMKQWQEEFAKCEVPVYVYSNDTVNDNRNIDYQCHLVSHKYATKLCSSLNWFRIIYDEIDTTKAYPFAGKFNPQTTFEWLLTANIHHEDYFSTKSFAVFETYNLSSSYDKEFRIPNATRRAWGKDFYPLNVVNCSEEFITKSQNLCLLEPKIIYQKVKTNSMVAFLRTIGSSWSEHLLQLRHDDFCFLRTGESQITSMSAYIKVVTEKENKKKIQIQHSLHMLKHQRDQQSKISIESQDTIIQGICNQEIKRLSEQIHQQENLLDITNKGLTEIEQRLNCDTLCSICLEEKAKPKTMVNCCKNFFCYGCIVLWMQNSACCPHCRQNLTAADLIVSEMKFPKLLSRIEQTIRLCESNTKKILIFCDYDGTYETISRYCRMLKLNGDQENDARVLTRFKDEKQAILFLNSRNDAKGHNLEYVDHIILYHDVDLDRKRQIIGRAQRPGRDVTQRLLITILEEVEDEDTTH